MKRKGDTSTQAVKETKLQKERKLKKNRQIEQHLKLMERNGKIGSERVRERAGKQKGHKQTDKKIESPRKPLD